MANYVSTQSVAYDLGMFESKPVVLRSQAVQKTYLKPKINFVSFVLIIAIAAAMALLVGTGNLHSNMIGEQSALQKELSALKGEETVLSATQKQRFSISQIEDYAVNQLGMVKMAKSQIEYVDLSGGGERVYVNGRSTTAKSSFLQEVGQFFGLSAE